MSTHSLLTGTDLHESKGVAAATAGQVDVADGAGSQVWKLLTTASIDPSSFKQTNKFFFTCQLPDLSTPSSQVYLGIPINCTINSIQYVLNNAITSADGSIIATNVTVGSMGTKTITQSGSTAGSTFTQTITTNNSITAGGHISIVANSGSSTTCIVYVTVSVTLT